MDSKSGIILYDCVDFKNLWPLNFTKPIAHLRLSFFTIQQQWQQIIQKKVVALPATYLRKKFPPQYFESNFYVNASIVPSKALWQVIEQMPIESILAKKEKIVAVHSTKHFEEITDIQNFKGQQIKLDLNINWLNHPADFFKSANGSIKVDESLIDKNTFANPNPAYNNIFFNEEDIWIHPTATIKAVTINAEKGPVIIGKDALIMEGALLRGPLSIGNNAVIKMGTKIYGPTAIGPYCKVGGEIKNTVFQAYSNKGHEGYLGNSVIGEWCNLGADTNCSNLKNNYSKVKVWNYFHQDYLDSGTQFHGLVMGDHCKCSINTMFNTGTVVGVFANIFGSGFHPKFVPSFTWGGNETYSFDKAIETARRVMQRKNITLSSEDVEILQSIYAQTEIYRN